MRRIGTTSAVAVLVAPAGALAQAASAPDPGRPPLAWLWLVVGFLLLAVLGWLLFTYEPSDPERAVPRSSRDRERR